MSRSCNDALTELNSNQHTLTHTQRTQIPTHFMMKYKQLSSFWRGLNDTNYNSVVLYGVLCLLTVVIIFTSQPLPLILAIFHSLSPPFSFCVVLNCINWWFLTFSRKILFISHYTKEAKLEKKLTLIHTLFMVGVMLDLKNAIYLLLNVNWKKIATTQLYKINE